MWRRKGEGYWKRGMVDEAVPLCGKWLRVHDLIDMTTTKDLCYK